MRPRRTAERRGWRSDRAATKDEILEEYEGLSDEDIQACLLFATRALEGTSFMPLYDSGEERSGASSSRTRWAHARASLASSGPGSGWSPG